MIRDQRRVTDTAIVRMMAAQGEWRGLAQQLRREDLSDSAGLIEAAANDLDYVLQELRGHRRKLTP